MYLNPNQRQIPYRRNCTTPYYPKLASPTNHNPSFYPSLPQSPNDIVPNKMLEELRNEGSSKNLNDNEVFRLYFTWMMNKENVGDSSSTITLARIIVAICDSREVMVYELRKTLGESFDEDDTIEFMDLL